jgi:hypothetical protein
MPTNGKIAGVVLEGATPVPSCTVRLYDRPTGSLLSSEVTGVYGNFLFSGLDETLTANYFVVAFDPIGGVQYNAIVFDYLTPVTSLTRTVETIGSTTDVSGSAKVEFTSYEATIKNLTPLAYWRLSEATGAPNDEQNFADMAVSSGTFTYAQSSGLFIAGDTAIRHGTVGTNEYMSTGKVTGLVPGASGFSVVFLVKPDTNAYYQKWLEWRDYGAGAADKPILSFIMHGISGFEVVAQPWSSDVYQAVGAPTVRDDRWHLCGVTYDAGTNTQKMYFDGAVTATRTPATPPAWPTQASITLFNAAEGVNAYSAECTLDEVAIFDYPLSALQMSRIAGRWNSAMRFNAEDKEGNTVLSNGDMTVAGTAANWGSARLTHSKNTGRWYWEVLVESNTGNSLIAGVSATNLPTGNYAGTTSGSTGIWARAGSAPIVYIDGANTTLSVPPIVVGDVLGFVLDADIKECRIYINGVLVFARTNSSSQRQFPTISCLQNGRGTIRLRGGDFTYPQPAHTAAYGDAEYAPPVVAGWDATAKGDNWRVSQLSYLASYPQQNSWQSIRAITTRNSGVRYFEITMPSAMYAGGAMVGVLNAAHPLTMIGVASGGWGYISDARKLNAGATAAYGTVYGANDVLGVLVDFTAGSVEFIKNGVSQGVAYATGVAGNLYPAISNYIGYGAVSLNMGREPFIYTLPPDAVAWDS